MKKIFVALCAVLGSWEATGQFNNPLSQYNQLPYLQSPALSGVEEITDVKMLFRRQWTSFRGAPSSYFLGANMGFRQKNFVTRGGEDYNRPIKIGFSGYLAESKYDIVNDFRFNVAHATHVPVSRDFYVSLGIAVSYNKLRADVREVIVRDVTDPFYLNLLNSNGNINYLNIDVGGAFYGEHFFASYAMQRLVRSRFTDALEGNATSDVRHTILAGYNHTIHNDWELHGNVLVRHEAALKTSQNYSVKARYLGIVWGGFNFSVGESIGILTGYKINHMFTFCYSFDLNTGSIRAESIGSHEVILGFTPFKNSSTVSFLW